MGAIVHEPRDTVEFIESEILRCSNDLEFDRLTEAHKVDFMINLIMIIHSARSNALLMKGEG